MSLSDISFSDISTWFDNDFEILKHHLNFVCCFTDSISCVYKMYLLEVCFFLFF